jgi:hypothetical protein
VCDHRADSGDWLECVILMPGKRGQETVRLRSIGTVLRAEAWDNGGSNSQWRITATIESYRFEREQGQINKGWSRPLPPKQRTSGRDTRPEKTGSAAQPPLLSAGTL